MTNRADLPRGSESGVTLVEVLVALVLFALIGGAGFSVLDQVLRVQSRTDGRLEHLADVQRAMHLVTRDFMQATGGSLSFAGGGVAFRRTADPVPIALRYELEGTALVRGLARSSREMPVQQVLLTGVQRLDWRFFAPETGWIDTWPPKPTNRPANPAAIALEVTLVGQGLSGKLRRVAVLPAEAAPP